MPYIHFTEEQIYRANAVDLEQLLQRQGEILIKSGREKRLASDHSITIHGNTWYDHSDETGGLAINFVKNFYGLSFPDAMIKLLGDDTGIIYEPTKQKSLNEPKPFVLPPAHSDMRRAFAYLLKSRLIDRDIVAHFAKEKLIYESCEYIKNKQGATKEYHNLVFVGIDENGVARHAHKRGLYTDSGYKGNVDSSDPAYSFHHIGIGTQLHVFEAPIDMLSFISLHPHNWQDHSYVALCGVAEHAMLKMLDLYPQLQEVRLCLDHDETGIESAGRLTEILAVRGYNQVSLMRSSYKDWNEDIKARNGLAAIPAEEHPQILLCAFACERISDKMAELPKAAYPEKQFPDLFRAYKNYLQWGRLEKTIECMENIATFSLAAAAREYRQMGSNISLSELIAMLQNSFKPYQNRCNIHNRTSELAQVLQTALSQKQMGGIRSLEQKQQQADAWMDLALGCVKVVVSTQAEELKQLQKQKNTQTITMALS